MKSQRRNHRHKTGLEQGFQWRCIHLHHLPHITHLLIPYLTLNKSPINPTDTYRLPPQAIDSRHDFLIDQTAEHRRHHLKRRLISHPLAMDKTGGSALPRQPLGHHTGTAMYHYQ